MSDYQKVPLTDEQKESKKMDLEKSEIHKASTDLELKRMEKMLDKKIPNKQTEDAIKRMEKEIKDRKDKDGYDLYDSDIEIREISIEQMKEQLEKDLPMKNLRYQIKYARDRKNAIDSPDQQIPKLKRELKNGYAEVYQPQQQQKYTE